MYLLYLFTIGSVVSCLQCYIIIPIDAYWFLDEHLTRITIGSRTQFSWGFRSRGLKFFGRQKGSVTRSNNFFFFISRWHSVARTSDSVTTVAWGRWYKYNMYIYIRVFATRRVKYGRRYLTTLGTRRCVQY